MGKKTDRDIAELIISTVQDIKSQIFNINNNCFTVQIITQPAAYIDAVLGDDVSVSVVAVNAVSYEWYKKKTTDTTWSKVSGATDATLSFTATETGNTSYRCTLTGKDNMSIATSSCLVRITSE